MSLLHNIFVKVFHVSANKNEVIVTTDNAEGDGFRAFSVILFGRVAVEFDTSAFLECVSYLAEELFT